MKITKAKLKEIIKEELEEGGYAGHRGEDPSGGMRASNAKLRDYLSTKLGAPLAGLLIAAVEKRPIEIQLRIMNLVDDMVIREE